MADILLLCDLYSCSPRRATQARREPETMWGLEHPDYNQATCMHPVSMAMRTEGAEGSKLDVKSRL